jgi:putative ABC transport system substrate-binding protein
MKRREFIALIGTTLVGHPLTSRAQQALKPLIGFLSSRSPQEASVHTAAFSRGLHEVGFTQDQSVEIIFRWAEGHYERLSGLAEELVRLRPSVMIAGGGAPSALAAKSATAAIPIVFLIGDDPVKLGLTASYGRPGGNLTGVSFLTGELGGKRLGLVCELAPAANPVALLLNPGDPGAALQRQDVQAAADRLGRRLIVLHASSVGEFEAIFQKMAEEHVGALVVENDPFFDSQRDRLMAIAAQKAIPAIYHIREFSMAGGLMSYGASLADAYRQVGNYAGRILQGEKVSELPVLQPTTFELVINLSTAKSLGLTVPSSLLARADEVIE